VPSPASQQAVYQKEKKELVSMSRNSNTKPASKRKTSNQGVPRGSSKKSRRSKSKDTIRYFVEPLTIKSGSDSETSIIVDDDEEEEEEEDDEDIEAGLTGLELDTPRLPLPPTPRAYSPSQLVNDSSDDEVGIEAVFPSLPIAPPSVEPVTLSTFQPVLGENMFILTEEERASLGMSAEPAIALVLSPSDTVYFIGTTQLCVLKGAVTLFGTTIRASGTYPVFAPKSSPVPVIEVSKDKSETSQGSLGLVPQRMQWCVKTGNAVVALQELRTGVEGLGRVVRTFDGLFTPPAGGAEQLPLTGVHMVSTTCKGCRSL
jgi:polynucleotide 5'-hydroxyl-kinase GRC3/NOL9